MAKFRTIDYGQMLYETLRAYFAVNDAGELSLLYLACVAYLEPLQVPFNNYHTYRINASIIANCKFQIGQLTNVLNYLYDNIENRIFITQSSIASISDPTFHYPAINFDPLFGEGNPLQERVFFDKGDINLTTINIPNTVNQSQLTATVEQIKLQGIPYQIVVI